MHRLDEGSLGTPDTPIAPNPELRQRRRMLVALAVLLLALILVVVRNRQFLYPSAPATDADVTQSAQEAQPKTPTADTKAQPAAPPAISTSKSKTPAHVSPSSKAKPQVEEAPAIATTERAVLPALQVEVVAGDTHRTVHPGSNSIKVEMQPGTPAQDSLSEDAEAAASAPAVDASERVRMSADAAQLVSHQVTPNYPLLAKQMKVQGAVILQALIGKEGNIQDLQVLSGPSILSSAAREAVKQWRFKPYLQAGQPVETQARITVNFTISTY